MKALVLYFSGTKNTEYVANRMGKQLIELGIKADIFSIEQDEPINTEDYDYFLIGGPVYVERYSHFLIKYVKANIKPNNKPCMLFSTQASNKLTPTFGHGIKQFKGLNITYCDFIEMPNNFYNFMFPKFSEEKEKETIEKVESKVKKMVSEFIKGEIKLNKLSNFRNVIADFAYVLTYDLYKDRAMGRLEIDKDLCTACMLCEKKCPTKSLKVLPKLSINKSCIFCQRCLNNCPTNAFKYKNKDVDQYKIR